MANFQVLGNDGTWIVTIGGNLWNRGDKMPLPDTRINVGTKHGVPTYTIQFGLKYKIRFFDGEIWRRIDTLLYRSFHVAVLSSGPNKQGLSNFFIVGEKEWIDLPCASSPEILNDEIKGKIEAEVMKLHGSAVQDELSILQKVIIEKIEMQLFKTPAH